MTITLGHQKMWALYDITSRFIVPLRYFITFGCNLLLYEIISFRISLENIASCGQEIFDFTFILRRESYTRRYLNLQKGEIKCKVI